MVIRIKKEDAAYLYQLLESYEGLTNYSTLTSIADTPYREIQLHKSPEQVSLLKRMLGEIANEIELSVLEE